jgi:hypothetical protein
MTQDEIAKRLGCGRTEVQKLETSALAKLRAAFGSNATGPASRYLRDYDGKRIEDETEGTSRNGENGKTARRVRGRFAR